MKTANTVLTYFCIVSYKYSNVMGFRVKAMKRETIFTYVYIILVGSVKTQLD